MYTTFAQRVYLACLNPICFKLPEEGFNTIRAQLDDPEEQVLHVSLHCHINVTLKSNEGLISCRCGCFLGCGYILTLQQCDYSNSEAASVTANVLVMHHMSNTFL